MPSRQAQPLDPARRLASETTFVRFLALVCAVLSVLPALFAVAIAPPGSMYLGSQYNLDDHMVYAAWMRQAMDGLLLFDNRFTTDPQPGLTVHVYFLLLGWIAKLLGIPLTVSLARAAFTIAFVFLLYRLARRVCPDVYTTKLAMVLSVFGMGIGFAVWHTFGRTIEKPAPQLFSNLLMGRLPTDVWQPEGYVFSSMLTNSLFMASLCLILVVFLSFLSARDSWRRVPHGVVAMGLLMNIHSYDVLLIAMVMAGYLVMAFARRQVTGIWLLRSLCIAAGALPAALWFLYVLRNDPVFQSRAATETFSPNFRQVVLGYLLLIVLALVGIATRKADLSNGPRRVEALAAAVLIGGFFLAAAGHQQDGYFLNWPSWLALLAAVYLTLSRLAGNNAAWNLVAAWSLVGTFAPYFPALFQRKLSMGLSVPWAILAALGGATLIQGLERGARNLALVLVIVATSGSSLRWLVRELELAKLNVSNTTVHQVFLSADAARIVALLNSTEGGRRAVVMAMPGFPSTRIGEDGRPVPDAFQAPYLPDLNPVLSGLVGMYSYAGHWSETPDYNSRRSLLTRAFLSATTEQKRRDILAEVRPDYIVAPVPEAFPDLRLADMTRFGEVVYSGAQFRLIRLAR